MTDAIDTDLLDGLSIAKVAAKHGVGQTKVQQRRTALGLTKKGKPAKKTPAQIAAARAADAARQQAAQDQLAALRATGGDISRLCEYRARYGPKCQPWTITQVQKMYQDAVK